MVFHAHMKATKDISDLLTNAESMATQGFYNTFQAYMSIAFNSIGEIPDKHIRDYYIRKYDVVMDKYNKGEKHGL